MPLLLLPALVLPADPAPAENLFFRDLALNRGAILLVEAPAGWDRALDEPVLRARLKGVMVRRLRLTEAPARRLGLSAPGAYFTDRAGRVLRAVAGEVPSDLPELLEALGWRSSLQVLRRFIAEHPERVDARWALLDEARRELAMQQEDRTLQQVAEALALLLEREDWPREPGRYHKPLLPEAAPREDNPLAQAARRHWGRVVEALRTEPGNLGVWSLLDLLAAWRPDAPWLYRIALDLEPLPTREGGLSPDWPDSLVMELCARQLRERKHWRGMAEFAAQRLGALEAYQDSFHADSLNEWSGLVIASPTKTERPTRRETLKRQAGRWYLLAFEAAVEEGRLEEAQTLARQLADTADGAALAKARALAVRHRSTTLQALLAPKP